VRSLPKYIGRHITLQNLYRTLHFLFKNVDLSLLSKQEKLNVALIYYSSVKETLSAEWLDYSGHRLTHIVCLDALSIAAGRTINKFLIGNNKKTIDHQSIVRSVKKLKQIDWSSSGPLRFIKGLSGSRSLSEEIIELIAG
jgi:DNA sulfur modification protein DndB